LDWLRHEQPTSITAHSPRPESFQAVAAGLNGRVADRLYAIDRGEIIFQGDPQSAFQNEDLMKTIRG
jgi:hypothetical protein